MSADLLRKAAGLMRERAEGATLALGDEPWNWDTGWCDQHGPTYTVRGEHVVAEAMYEEVAEYLCPMQPVVALAVADWLDMCAGMVANYGPNAESPWVKPHTQMALTVARAYLGQPA